jgi:hypothetical protein
MKPSAPKSFCCISGMRLGIFYGPHRVLNIIEKKLFYLIYVFAPVTFGTLTNRSPRLCLSRVCSGRVEIGGGCIRPLSWIVHHNFVRDGRYSERGCWASTAYSHQPGLIFLWKDTCVHPKGNCY